MQNNYVSNYYRVPISNFRGLLVWGMATQLTDRGPNPDLLNAEAGPQ